MTDPKATTTKNITADKILGEQEEAEGIVTCQGNTRGVEILPFYS